jgi:hypothetical protein
MSKLNKDIFIVSLVIAIFAIILLNIVIKAPLNILNYGMAQGGNMVSTSLNAVGGSADMAVFGISTGALVQFASGVSIIVVGLISAITTIGSFIYMLFYLISFLITRKNLSKAKIITSIVLNVIAILIQGFIVYLLWELFVPVAVIQIAAILTIVIMYLANIKNIKQSLEDVKNPETK